MKDEPEAVPPLEEFTPGPWRWEVNLGSRTIRLCGGVPRYDLTVMDFVRWGMGNAAPRFRRMSAPCYNIMYRIEHFARVVLGREHHSDWFRRIDHADARLMEASPELLINLEKLLAYHQWAKSPGQWDEEPKDPEAEVVALIARVRGVKP